MHIVQVANFYGPVSGGIRTTMRELGRGYAERGHRSTIVVPGAADSVEDSAYGTVVTLGALRVPGSGGYRVLTDVDAVCTVLQGLRPDRIEVSDRLTLRSLGRWGRAYGVPTVMWAHERVDGVLDAWLPGPWPTTWLADRWNGSTMHHFEHVVCSTSFARAELDRIGWREVSVVPLGVDLDQFHPQRRATSVRARHLTPDDEVLVVSVSRLSKEKRVDLTVDALRHLRASGNRARLVVAGEGPARARLERRAAGLPVTFLGHLGSRNEVADLLAAADVVVNPGPIETFCLAALEALASGTPVVASSGSAVGEVIGGTGGRVAAAHPIALADAVRAVLGEDGRQRRLGARTRAESFPWTRTVDLMLELHDRPGAAEPRLWPAA